MLIFALSNIFITGIAENAAMWALGLAPENVPLPSQGQLKRNIENYF